MRHLICFFLGIALAIPAQAQHAGMHHAPDTSQSAASPMSSFTLPNLPMQRDGSGTAWLPDTSPMYGAHTNRGDWGLMLHGAAFLRYTTQDVFDSGSRGDQKLDAPNWIMGMAKRSIGRHGQLALRSMVSLEPLTIGSGYPLLFQTGETYEGEPLIDRQHPHDLFTELSVTYGHAIGEQAGFFAYLGWPGQPALGPVVFMHRPSARHNPDAPLGHHWQDATHITFGTATLGLRYGPVMIDGSLFTGREPNEDRYGLDKPRFDSYSLRLSSNPTDNLAIQVSRGFLKSPEAHEPDADQIRTTASAIYHRPLAGGLWTNTLLWGRNEPSGDDDDHGHGHGTQNAFLAESDVQFGKQALYARAEWLEKSAGELGLESHETRTFSIGALTLGTAREVLSTGPLAWMVGAQGIVYRVPEALRPAYGNQPFSLEIYLRVSPRLLGPH